MLIDTESWEQTPVCRVDGNLGIEQLCWVNSVECIIIQQVHPDGTGGVSRGGVVYSMRIPEPEHIVVDGPSTGNFITHTLSVEGL